MYQLWQVIQASCFTGKLEGIYGPKTISQKIIAALKSKGKNCPMFTMSYVTNLLMGQRDSICDIDILKYDTFGCVGI